MIKVLITGVGDSLGISVIKSLQEYDKIQVFGGDADPLAPGLFDSKLNDTIVLPYANKQNYQEELLKFCKKKDIDVFIPGSEPEIIEVSGFTDTLKSVGTKTLLPDYRTLMKAANKFSTVQIARELDIPHPKTIHINFDRFDDKEILDKLEFPLIVKPCRGRGAKGVEYYHTYDELITNIGSVLEDDREYLLQEVIPGEEGSMYAFGTIADRDHNLKAEFSSRSIKTKFDHGGPAIAGESTRNERVIELGKKLINGLAGWVGPAMIEFMLDPRDNKFKLMEINPRLWGYNYLATGAGINFPKLIVDLALDKEVAYHDSFEDGKLLVRYPNDIIIDKDNTKFS